MLFVPFNVPGSVLTQILKSTKVLVHSADGTVTESNLYDQADAVRHGTAVLHAAPAGVSLA